MVPFSPHQVITYTGFYLKLSRSFIGKIEKAWGQIDDGPSKNISKEEDLQSTEMSTIFWIFN